MSLLALLALANPAFADCKPAYEQAIPRALVGGISSIGLGLSSTAAAYPTIAFGIVGGALLKSDAIVVGSFLITGTELAGGAALSGTSGVLLVRRASYGKVLALIEEAEQGDGPALSAYVADLNAETGRGWNLSNVAAAIDDVNAAEGFCGPDGLLRYPDADQLIRLELDREDAAPPIEVLPLGEKPEMP